MELKEGRNDLTYGGICPPFLLKKGRNGKEGREVREGREGKEERYKLTWRYSP